MADNDNSNGKTPSATVVYDKFFSNLETLSGIAEKGASHSLLTIGMSVIAVALLTKFKIGGLSVLFLEQAEFIAFVIVGFLLMLTASIMRIYIFKSQMELERRRNKLGADLLRGSQETAGELTKKDDDIVNKSGA